MTPYLLLAFILTPGGNVVAQASPQLYMGADQCIAQVEPLAKSYEAQGLKPDNVRILCIDSRLYPGKGA